MRGEDPVAEILSAARGIPSATCRKLSDACRILSAACRNLLRWSRSGNTKGTVYVVEVRPSGGEDWSYVDTTSRLSYKHTGQIPGTAQDYRVYALRSGLKSPASDVASVYAANPTV